MSSCDGTFDLTRIDMCQTLILIAAGTGLTPMIRILNYVIKQISSKKDINVILLFFNKTQNDILCRDELQTISNQHK
jgi:cytochrome-b5 reductase